MGIHGEWSQLNSFDVGFNYRLYYGSTDEGNDFAVDEVHRKVNLLFWIPELGSYGIFKRGESVDVTRRGVQEKQKKEILKLVAKLDNTPDQKFLSYIRGAYGSGTTLAPEAYKILKKWLLTRGGLQNTWHPSFPWDWKYTKETYTDGNIGYGNIEFKYLPGQNAFSSYNYGNNIIDHFFLDVIGYGMSN